jgi:hypothetical protein
VSIPRSACPHETTGRASWFRMAGVGVHSHVGDSFLLQPFASGFTNLASGADRSIACRSSYGRPAPLSNTVVESAGVGHIT